MECFNVIVLILDIYLCVYFKSDSITDFEDILQTSYDEI